MRPRELDLRFSKVVVLLRRLRSPGGCPWDRAQTHRSLIRYLREESRELEGAIRRGHAEDVREELGDLLLQILFHAEIARENGQFDIGGVIRILEKKLIRRHPHVFSRAFRGRIRTAADVVKQWRTLKRAERRGIVHPAWLKAKPGGKP